MHEVYYDDGIFWENLTSARWKLDANEGPSGEPIVHEWEKEREREKKQQRQESSRHVLGKESEIVPNGKGRSDKNSSREDAGGKRRTSHAVCNGSVDTEDLTGDSRLKRAKPKAVDDKERREKQPAADTRKQVSNDTIDSMPPRSSGKIVLKYPASGEGGANAATGDGKRSREGTASGLNSKRAKRVTTEEDRKGTSSKTEGDAPTVGSGGDEVNLTRLRMEGRQWTTPGMEHKKGGNWLVGRSVRLYWDDEAHWFPGIVEEFDGREDAIDSHGSIGAVHSILYDDGRFDENLSTARWQFDAKEGPAGVNIDGKEDLPEDKSQGRLSSVDAKSSTHSVAAENTVSSVKATPDDEMGEDRGAKGWPSECSKLLGRLMRQDSAIPFLEPVDPVAMNLPDYFDIIKNPMDLGTVKSNLEQNRYTEPAQVLKDIVRCFENAIEYNPGTEPAHKLAIAMNASFTSLCNGSQLLRPVLRCLDLSRGGSNVGNAKVIVSSPSPSKKAMPTPSKKVIPSPSKKAMVGATTDKVGGDPTKDTGAQQASEEVKREKHEYKSSSQPGQAAKRGGPRMAAAAKNDSEGGVPEDQYPRLKINQKGRLWTAPTGSFMQGGSWLVGRHIRVYWDDDREWFAGIVTFYDNRPNTKDSHGNMGPAHDVYYEDGSFLENLSTAKWQFDLNEGPVGKIVDLSEDDKKPSTTSSSVHTNPRAACDSCRQRRIRCVHMAAAAEAAGLKVPSPRKPEKQKAGAGAMQQPVRQLASVAMAEAALAPQSPNKIVYEKPLQLRGVKQDLSRKELEYEVVYGLSKTTWTTGLNKDAKFRELLLAFIQQAFPDRSVLHPWMPDFKKHMWNWGYR